MDVLINDKVLMDDMDRLIDRAENLYDPLAATGDLLTESAQTTIKDGGRPDPWNPPKLDYGHPLLQDTGALLEGIEYSVGQDEVVMGNPVEYAVFQNATRPFMMAQDQDLLKIDDIISQHFLPT